MVEKLMMGFGKGNMAQSDWGKGTCWNGIGEREDGGMGNGVGIYIYIYGFRRFQKSLSTKESCYHKNTNSSTIW